MSMPSPLRSPVQTSGHPPRSSPLVTWRKRSRVSLATAVKLGAPTNASCFSVSGYVTMETDSEVFISVHHVSFCQGQLTIMLIMETGCRGFSKTNFISTVHVLHVLPCVLQNYSNISFDEQQKLKLWSV